MHNPVPAWRRRLVATDPGGLRLTNAVVVASAVLVSGVFAWLLVLFAGADRGLLTMGSFLALQMGLVVRDRTARERELTTVLLLVPLLASVTVSTLLAPWRIAEIVAFIAIAGTVTWMRRFGPRASGLGMMVFFGYFYALCLRPSIADLPDFAVVAASAVVAVLISREIAARTRPSHQLTLLLTEFRAAGAAALGAATAPARSGGRTKSVIAQLGHIDAIGAAITEWQSHNSTERFLDRDEATFAAQVLDARIELDQACLEIAEQLRQHNRVVVSVPDGLASPIADLRLVLAVASTPAGVEAAAERAAARLGRPISTGREQLAATTTDRAVIAHAVLRTIDVHRGPLQTSRSSALPGHASAEDAQEAACPSAVLPAGGPKARGPIGIRPWAQWQTTSRMAVQVMVATAAASIAGEIISGRRWYWAVLTAFIVFGGTTTRGAILTKAWRRVLGTLLGVVVGFGLAVLIDGNIPGLIAMCVLAVMLTLYLGPLQYTLLAFFITIVMAAMYGLLGVLNRQVMELRLVETLVGAGIGVVCAYLIFSTNSRGELENMADSYFDALDQLLEQVRGPLTGRGPGRHVLQTVNELDAANTAIAAQLSMQSVSLLAGDRARYTELEHLMGVVTRFADRLAAEALDMPAAAGGLRSESSAPAAGFDAAVDRVLASAQAARGVICRGEVAPVDPDETVVAVLAESVLVPGSVQFDTARGLSRVNWALLRAAQVDQQPRRRARRAAGSSGAPVR